MAKSKWIKTSFPGVRYREHPTRKHGINKDRYFTIRFKLNGRDVEEGLGWTTSGMSAKKASVYLAKLKEAHLTGEGPQTLGEHREQAREMREQEQAQKEVEVRDSLTFGKFFLHTYFPQAKANKVEKSWTREDSLFRLWIRPTIGGIPLKDVSPLDLERIKKRMGDAGRAPRSIHYCLAVIRQTFNLARILDRYKGDNPVSKVKKPTVDNRRVRFLSYEEAECLLQGLNKCSEQLHDMALTSLDCGARASEIFNLTFDCVDLQRESMLLKDTKDSHKGTKSRTVYMTVRVKKMLARRKLKQTNGLVFSDVKGNKITQISNAFGRVVNELGFNKDVTDRRFKVIFHTLRHTFASWLVEKGESLYVVKELLGHSTLAMTERYSHLAPNTLRDAIKKLDS